MKPQVHIEPLMIKGGLQKLKDYEYQTSGSMPQTYDYQNKKTERSHSQLETNRKKNSHSFCQQIEEND
jgi:hypothetical protein